MANRNFNPVQAPESEVKILTGNFTAVASSNGTTCQGAILTATRTGTGLYDIVLQPKNKYPAGSLLFPSCSVLGTGGDRGFVSVHSSTAGTLKLRLYTSAGALDDCDGKVVYIQLTVRNSTSRRGT